MKRSCRAYSNFLKGCKSCEMEDYIKTPRGKKANIKQTSYPFDMSKEQWRKWVACEAMKGMIPTQMFTRASIIENAYEFADAFLKEGGRNE